MAGIGLSAFNGMVAMAAASASERFLLYDYVPWEQFSKQRRGASWALQAARSAGRTLVLPPVRFHTPTHGEYEYYPFSLFFDLEHMRKLHPVRAHALRGWVGASSRAFAPEAPALHRSQRHRAGHI